MTVKEGKERAQELYREMMGEEWVEKNARTIFDSLRKADNDPDMYVYVIYQSLYDGSSPMKDLFVRLRSLQEVPEDAEHKTTFVLDLRNDRVEVAENY